MAGLKVCTSCKEHLLPDFFSKKSARCKPCAVDASRAWAQKNPERVRKSKEIYRQRYAGTRINGYRLKYRYGITLEDHKQLFASQDGKCAICCEAFDKTPHVDHCHKTGSVRGLLCDRCNRGLGYFKDSPVLLIEASKYLEGEK